MGWYGSKYAGFRSCMDSLMVWLKQVEEPIVCLCTILSMNRVDSQGGPTMANENT
jgi:hypothetical protein